MEKRRAISLCCAQRFCQKFAGCKLGVCNGQTSTVMPGTSARTGGMEMGY